MKSLKEQVMFQLRYSNFLRETKNERSSKNICDFNVPSSGAHFLVLGDWHSDWIGDRSNRLQFV